MQQFMLTPKYQTVEYAKLHMYNVLKYQHYQQVHKKFHWDLCCMHWTSTSTYSNLSKSSYGVLPCFFLKDACSSLKILYTIVGV